MPRGRPQPDRPREPPQEQRGGVQLLGADAVQQLLEGLTPEQVKDLSQRLRSPSSREGSASKRSHESRSSLAGGDGTGEVDSASAVGRSPAKKKQASLQDEDAVDMERSVTTLLSEGDGGDQEVRQVDSIAPMRVE